MRSWVRRLWPPGVRAQLTVVYSGAFMIISVLSLIIFNVLLNAVILSGFDHQLGARADAIARDVDVVNNAFVIHDTATGVAILSSANPQNPPLHLPGDSQTFIRILDLQGKEQYYSQAFHDIHTSDASLVLALRRGEPVENQPYSSQVTLRILTVPLVPDQTPANAKQPKQIIGILQVGYPLSTRENFFFKIMPYSPFVGLGLLALSCIGGYALARRVFRPIHRLTRAARSLAEGNLSHRVPVPVSQDDVHVLAATFNNMAARMEATFTQQRRFVADASHELRTPVAAICGLTEVALTQGETEAMEAALRNVHAESERLGRLINDLLMLARIDEGRLLLDRDPVRLDHLAADVVASMQPLAEERGLHLELGQLAPVTVLGDAARLIQVLLSLLDNALTYTPTGGHVTVTVQVKEAQAWVSISDTGIGIEAADLPHVFERFYRADRARSRAAGGSGLGLALAQDIVRAHGGTIVAASQPGRGSTVTVMLAASAG